MCTGDIAGTFGTTQDKRFTPARMALRSRRYAFRLTAVGAKAEGSRMKAIYPLFTYLIIAVTSGFFAVTSGTQADSAALSDKSSWLLGNFTQNAPCKGDSSDPAELKVRIATDQIESKSGVCKFLAVTPEGNRLKANMECQFPAGPLIGDVTFTQTTNGSIDVVDRDNNYTAILYRCPK
jgi:hypothetical protein